MQLRLLDSAATGVDAVRSRNRQLQLHTREPSAARDAARVRFWRPLPRKVMDVICGEGTVTDVAFHTHEALQVLLPTSPFAAIGRAGRTTVVHPGVVHVTSPFEPCAARSVDGASFGTRIMLISPATLTALPPGLAGHPQTSQPPARWRSLAHAPDTAPFAELVVDDGELYAELMAVFDSLRRPLVELQCESRLLECLARLIARRAEPGTTPADAGAQPPAGVVRARDYLRAQAVKSVTLDELAAVAGLSKFYLLRAFARAYGLTPHAYQMELRLARARRLLAEGRPLSHVTYDAGFADQSHLTRRFAAFYGLTPARYARQLAAPPGRSPDRGVGARLAATPPTAA